jgi:hypothetical protein
MRPDKRRFTPTPVDSKVNDTEESPERSPLSLTGVVIEIAGQRLRAYLYGEMVNPYANRKNHH